MKTHIGRYDRAYKALEMDYPEELLDDDRKYLKSIKRQIPRPRKSYSRRNGESKPDLLKFAHGARKSVQRCKKNNAKTLLKDFQKKCQVIQDNMKPVETTAFNMMVIKAKETTRAFFYRLIE